MYIHIFKFFQNNQLIILMSYSEIKNADHLPFPTNAALNLSVYNHASKLLFIIP